MTTEFEHNEHTVIVTETEQGFKVELVLSNGFETEQTGYYTTYEEAAAIGRQWAEEDWSDYQ